MLKGPSTDTWYLEQLGRKVSAVVVPDRKLLLRKCTKRPREKNQSYSLLQWWELNSRDLRSWDPNTGFHCIFSVGRGWVFCLVVLITVTPPDSQRLQFMPPLEITNNLSMLPTGVNMHIFSPKNRTKCMVKILPFLWKEALTLTMNIQQKLGIATFCKHVKNLYK